MHLFTIKIQSVLHWFFFIEILQTKVFQNTIICKGYYRANLHYYWDLMQENLLTCFTKEYNIIIGNRKYKSAYKQFLEVLISKLNS